MELFESLILCFCCSFVSGFLFTVLMDTLSFVFVAILWNSKKSDRGSCDWLRQAVEDNPEWFEVK